METAVPIAIVPVVAVPLSGAVAFGGEIRVADVFVELDAFVELTDGCGVRVIGRREMAPIFGFADADVVYETGVAVDAGRFVLLVELAVLTRLALGSVSSIGWRATGCIVVVTERLLCCQTRSEPGAVSVPADDVNVFT